MGGRKLIVESFENKCEKNREEEANRNKKKNLILGPKPGKHTKNGVFLHFFYDFRLFFLVNSQEISEKQVHLNPVTQRNAFHYNLSLFPVASISCKFVSSGKSCSPNVRMSDFVWSSILLSILAVSANSSNFSEIILLSGGGAAGLFVFSEVVRLRRLRRKLVRGELPPDSI